MKSQRFDNSWAAKQLDVFFLHYYNRLPQWALLIKLQD